jgi:hypothetical protein
MLLFTVIRFFLTVVLPETNSYEAGRYMTSVRWNSATGVETVNSGDTVAIDLLQPNGLAYSNASNSYTITGVTFNQNIGNTTFANGTQNQNFYIRVPNVTPGLWILRLATDTYYSCGLVNITVPSVEVFQSAAGTVVSSTDVGTFTPGQSTFFEMTYPAMTGLLVRLTGQIATPITASIGRLSNTLPNQLPGYGTNPGPVYDTVSTSVATTDGSTVSVGTCADGMATNSITYLVGVYVDAGATSYQVEFNANNQVRLNVPDGNRSITYSHQDYLYFYTQAASGLDGNVRIHLTVPTTQVPLPTEFSGATNCAFSTGTFSSQTTVMGNTICLDIPKTQGTKYIKVSAMSSSGYTIGKEFVCFRFTNTLTSSFAVV